MLKLTRSLTDDELLRFLKLVKLMRHSQERYFQGDRSREALLQSKDLEGRVDRAIGWMTAGSSQPTLPFGETDRG